jgi:hypothetical protein
LSEFEKERKGKPEKRENQNQPKLAQPKPPHGPGRLPLLSLLHGPARPSSFPSPHPSAVRPARPNTRSRGAANACSPSARSAPRARRPRPLTAPAHPSGRRLPHAARSLSAHPGPRVGSIPLLPPEFPASSTFCSASPNPAAPWTSRPHRPTRQPCHHLLEAALSPDHANAGTRSASSAHASPPQSP